ncbi:MAG: tetratricopeptide repeat protein [Acidobacteria bacterium]|nr:tetratricopeptide repeat protein [Acidobacteriota bacterium]
MGRNGKHFAMYALLIVLLVAGSGCQLIDKLKARDRLNKGVTAYTEKKYDEAIGYFEEAIRLDPDLMVANVYLATTYRTMFIPGGRSPDNDRNAQKAIEIYQEVLKRDPKDIGTIASLARIYADLEQYEIAKEWYRKRLEADPSNPEPLYGIGSTDYSLVSPRIGTTGEKVKDMPDAERADVERLVDEGIDVLKKAMEIRPKYSDAAQFLNLLYREKAKLVSKEEKDQWLKEADKLALNAMEWQKEEKEEEARARKSMGGAEGKTE